MIVDASQVPSLSGVAARVWQGARRARFAGSDPYDGLKSRLLSKVLGHSRLLRLVTIQAVKRSPIDLRPLLAIPPGTNPKALALFLGGVRAYPALESSSSEIGWLEDALLSLASQPDGRPAFGNRSHRDGIANAVRAGDVTVPAELGWGYDFPWQSRAFLQPAFHPTVVASSFVIDALVSGSDPALDPVRIATARFIHRRVPRRETGDGVCFSYSPRDHTRVYNASLLAARTLACAARGEVPERKEWNALAEQAGDYVVSQQRGDGAWRYGEASHWQWVDNFHTGYVLDSLKDLAGHLSITRWDEAIERGMAYYRHHLFEPDGTARYTDENRYPLDPHAFAQGALTFATMPARLGGSTAFARDITARAIEYLWNNERGGFRFQKRRRYTIPTIHMRWSQGWMFRAICVLLAHDTDGPG